MARLRVYRVHSEQPGTMSNVVCAVTGPDGVPVDWPEWVEFGIRTKGWVVTASETHDTIGWIADDTSPPDWRAVADELAQAVRDPAMTELLQVDGYDISSLTAALDGYDVSVMQANEIAANLPRPESGEEGG